MEKEHWDIVVKPQASLFRLNLKEVWAYRDLLFLMVKRDVTTTYKQTVLGPLWLFIQPAFTTAIYTFTLSVSGHLSTDGIPAVLFYLLGQVFWNYFADCFTKTSNTFIANASIFGKVYFPRLVMPLSVVFSNLIKLGIQSLLLTIVYLYFVFTTDQVHMQFAHLLLLPVIIMFLGLFSLSLGIIFSSFTTKYRDLIFLLGFAIQLLMFASCVVFPVSMYSAKIQALFMYNPLVTFMETLRFILTGHGIFSWYYLCVSMLLIICILFSAIVVFNRSERSFIDTV